MGNQQTRESRLPGSSESPGGAASGNPSQGRTNRHTTSANPPRPDRRNRLSRVDVFGAFTHNPAAGASSSSHARDHQPLGAVEESPAAEEPFQRKETRQEREARRREKHAALRLAERERSLHTESVDGGFLVTLGTYTGPEDFGKSVVRQLQIERKLAPFWKGLENHETGWTDYQLAAAVRGLPIPDASEQPPDGFFARPSPDAAGQTLSVPGDASGTTPPRASSPFRHRSSRVLAAALNLGSSRTAASEPDVSPPREIFLPSDPNVEGRPIESALYRDATECPICFLSYPPFLNHTRCCSQPICSECFVQIKRPDPHLPEHHPGDDQPSPSAMPEEERDEELVSEPSMCPYCQQSELGVTYEPPPFRRGIAYSSDGGPSTTPSHTSPASPPPVPGARRRTYSLSANAPNVVTTDRIRPDWEIKLNTARQHRARRAAAATALHTAAFMTHPPTSWGRLALFRHAMATPGGPQATRQGVAQGTPDEDPHGSAAGPGPSTAASNVAVFSRLEEFENFLVAEGIRQSLASKETEDRKESKRKEKEERKARERADKEARKAREQQEKEERKQQKKSVYGAGGGGGSRSSLSLVFGRRRGNSTASVGPTATLPPPGEVQESEVPIDKGKAPARHISHSAENSVDDGIVGAPSSSSAAPHHHQVSSDVHPSALSLESAADSDGANAGPDTVDPLFNYRSLAEGIGMDIDTGRIEDTPAAVVSEEARAQEARQEEDVEASVATLKPQEAESQEEAGEPAPPSTTLDPPKVVVTPDTPAAGPGEGPTKFGLGPTSQVFERQEVTE